MKRSHAAKTIMSLADSQMIYSDEDLDEEEEEPEYLEAPDLAVYLGQFGMDPVDQIKLCRSYASYLSRLVPPSKPSAK